jgi:tetratricopeptide (TPR) repeat protein
MRTTAALAACTLFFACASLSTEESERLATIQRNAALYWEGGKLGQALSLAERGLDIDADDYKLQTLRAAIHLRMSSPSGADDQRMLDLALSEFEDIDDQRSLSRHDGFQLFFHGIARQKQGLRLLRDAERARHAVPPDEDAAAELREDADREFDRANELLTELIERGELLRLAHFHMLQVAASRADGEGVLRHGEAYLEAAKQEQAYTKNEIDQTMVFRYEVEQKRSLASLLQEEAQVRSFLAERLQTRGQLQAALEHLDRILTIDPTRTADYFNRGMLLERLARLNDAQRDMRRFLATTSLPPDSTQRQQAQEILLRR